GLVIPPGAAKDGAARQRVLDLSEHRQQPGRVGDRVGEQHAGAGGLGLVQRRSNGDEGPGRGRGQPFQRRRPEGQQGGGDVGRPAEAVQQAGASAAVGGGVAGAQLRQGQPTAGGGIVGDLFQGRGQSASDGLVAGAGGDNLAQVEGGGEPLLVLFVAAGLPI